MTNTISHYLITDKLGEGGMGEVYKAQDTTLDRPVALKILPAHLVEDQDRVRRFIQEAKSASALNHPNIVTIYEIGQVEATVGSAEGQGHTQGSHSDRPALTGTVHYIAMEFVDGTTLSAKIHNEREDLKKLLEYLAQVAEGLAKAHSAGIVHRDLKPDNIMVTRDRFAKILDFGLAKLVESSEKKPDRQQSADLEEAATAMMDKTRPGMVMGTVGYMSPEQVQGKPVDQRSDIFSFGCILYEAATRTRPFAGDSVIDSLHKIVYSQPASVRDANPVAPAEVQRIIRKCLAKDPGERYQSIKETAIDLRELIKEYDALATPSGPYAQAGLSGPPSQAPITGGFGQGITTGAGSGPYAGPQTGSYSGPATGTGLAAPQVTAPQDTLPSGPVSGPTEHLPRRNASRGILITIVMVFALLVIIGLVYVETTQKKHGASSRNAFQNRNVTKLTSTGKSIMAAISPDGKYVAHVVAEGGQQSLWLRQIATTTNITLAPAADVTYQGVTFSKDGNYVYYVTLEKGKSIRNLFQIPVLGGDSRKILADVDSAVSFSPDGKRFAFVRNVASNESRLLTARTDGSDEQMLTAHKTPNTFIQPSWSPDGKTIASLTLNFTGGYHAELVAIPSGGGAEKPIGSTRWAFATGVDWLSDGSALVVAALFRSGAQAPQQLWQVTYPDGKPRQITSDLNNYTGISLTSDSSAMATVQAEVTSNIWMAPGGDMSRATQLTTGSAQNIGPSWTPDGKVVYESTATGVDLWTMDSDGKNQKQLTSGAGLNVFPAVSPDGHFIAFCSNRAGAGDAFNIYRMDTDGGAPKQLTSGEGEYVPVFSADGKWIYYTPLQGTTKPSIWKVSIDSGAPMEAMAPITMFPAISPDGKWLLCRYSDGKSSLKLAVFPIDGATPTKTFDIDVTGIQAGRYRWSPDGKSITYIDSKNGVSNIWRQALSGGEPKQVTDIKSEQLFDFDWSTKGDLAVSKGTTTTDVVLIKESKQGDSQP